MRTADPEYRLLAETLKKLLKAHRLTYRDAARALKLSVPSIKRIMGRRDGPVGKLAAIARTMGLSFADLVAQAHARDHRVNYLTAAQEAFFAEHLAYYDVLVELVAKRRTPAELAAEHGLSASAVRRYLARLGRLGLIDVHAGGRVRPLIQEPIGFSADGAFRKKLVGRFARFVHTSSPGAGDLVLTREWVLTRAAAQEFEESLRALCAEIDQRAAREGRVHPRQDLVPLSLWIGALRRSPPVRIPEP